MEITYSTNYNYTITKPMKELNAFDKYTIECYEFSNVKYIGFLKKGKKHGEGFLFENGILSHCHFENGQKDGWCFEYFMSNLSQISFMGHYKDGKRHGICKLYTLFKPRNGPSRFLLQYEGVMENNKYHGEGKLFDEEKKIMYIGSFVNGFLFGWGKVCSLINGMEIYHGFFKKGKYDGQGILLLGIDDTDYVTSRYEGEFKDGKMHGKGCLFENSDDQLHLKMFEGEFKNNQIRNGTLYLNNVIFYEGNFLNFKFHGYGVLISSSEDIYVGFFKDGLKHGNGIIFNLVSLELICSGKFIKNIFQNEDSEFHKLEMKIEAYLNSSKGTNSLFLKKVTQKSLQNYYIRKNYPTLPENKNKYNIFDSILQFRFIEKSLATKSDYLYKKIKKSSLISYLNHHDIQFEAKNKKKIWKALLQYRENELKEDESKFDFFGNEIIDPVLANDSHIYDKKSLDELLERNIKVSIHNNIEICTYETFENVKNIPSKAKFFENFH